MADPHALLVLIGCKASLILAIVAVLVYATGRRWPRGCTQWQRLGVVALLLLPIATFFVPPIPIPILPAVERVVITRNEPVLTPDSSPASFFASDIPEFNDNKIALGSNTANLTQLFEDRSTPKQPVSVTIAADPKPHSLGISWSAVLSLIYGIVMSVFLLRLVGAGRGLCRLKRTGTRLADAEWQRLLSHWATTLRIRRAIDLRVTDEVSVPMTFGWLAPVILVPRDCLTSCDRTQREAILIHELTHIARGDFLWQILTQIVAAVYWLHPLVWLVRRESEVLRERLCDQFCSQQLGRETYARALVSIAARSRNLPAIGLGMAMAQRTSLRQRLADLKSGTSISSQRAGRVSGVLICGTATLLLGMIVIGLLSERVSKPATEPTLQTDVAQSPLGAIQIEPISSFVRTSYNLTVFGTDLGKSARLAPAGAALAKIMTAYDNNIGTAAIVDRTTSLEAPLSPEKVFAPRSDLRVVPDHYKIVAQKIHRSSLPPEIQANQNTPAVVYAFVEESDDQQKYDRYFVDTPALEQEALEFNEKVAATVNGTPILNGEVLMKYAAVLKRLRDKIGTFKQGTHGTEDYLKERDSLIRQDIVDHIEKAALAQHFMASKSPAEVAQINARIDEQFVTEIERLKKELKAESLTDVEQRLIESGSSLSTVKKVFANRQLAEESIALSLKSVAPVEYSDVVKFYESHSYLYELQKTADWQQVCVRKWQEHDPAVSKKLLEQIVAELNQGASFDDDELIPRYSRNLTLYKTSAVQTQFGVRGNNVIEEKISSLPLNQWSEIIETPSLLRVVRVTARQEARKKPIEEVQGEIESILKRDRDESEFIQKVYRSAKIEIIGLRFLPRMQRNLRIYDGTLTR